MKNIKKYITSILKNRIGFFLGLIALTLVSSFIAIILPVIFKKHLGNLEADAALSILIQSFAVYAGFLLLSAIVSVFWHFLITKFGAFILFDLRAMLKDRLENSYLNDVRKFSSNRLKYIVYSDSLVVFRVLVNFSIQVIAKTVVIILILIVIYISFSQIAFFLGFALLFGVLIANIARRKIAKVSRKVNESMKATHAEVNDYVDSIRLIQSHNINEYTRVKADRINAEFLQSALKADFVQVFFKNLQTGSKSIFSLLFITVLYVFNKYQVSTGDVVLLIFYSNIIWNYSTEIETLISSIGESVPSFSHIDELLGLKGRTGRKSISEINDIEVRNLSFGYGDELVVANLSMRLSRGDRIQLAGKNGAGKSTLISLLMNLYKPLNGVILVNGEELSEIDHRSYIGRIAYIDQIELLLEENIAEYLKIITDSKDKEKIGRILEKLNLTEKSKLTDNKMLDVQGTKLSGGQKKKLLLCKLLLKCEQSDLIIIDEITANMDSRTKAVYNELRQSLINDNSRIVIEINHNEELEGFRRIDIDKTETLFKL